jgi:hypothetical protein
VSNHLTHFAVHAQNVERAKTFYEHVFAWKFISYGPPDFCHIDTGGDSIQKIRGALQKRNAPVGGGFECTFSVESIEETIKKVNANGGKILMEPHTIPNVGTLIKFEDTEGNILCAMKYVEGLF